MEDPTYWELPGNVGQYRDDRRNVFLDGKSNLVLRAAKDGSTYYSGKLFGKWRGGIGHTWTLSPSLVLDGNFGLNRQDQHVTGPDFGQNLGTDVLGIPGTNGGIDRYSGLPAFDIDGATSQYDLGTTPNWMPLFRHERSYTLAIGLSGFLGRHGGEWNLLMAASTVVTIPLIAAFLLAQKTFIEGIALTGTKG